MNIKINWEGTREISGFGGNYEDACRKMVEAGVEWLKAHEKAQPEGKECSNIFGIIFDTNKDMDELQKAMCKAVEGCSGAMMHACTNHVMYILHNGIEKYEAEMKKKELPNAQGYRCRMREK